MSYRELLYCLIDGLGDIFNIATGDPAHADSARLEKVEMLLLLEEHTHVL